MRQNDFDTSFKRNPFKWAKDAWYLARPYWTSEEKWRAIGLVTSVIILNLLTVYISVQINKWYNGMYDSLQQFDKAAFYKSIIKFCYLAFSSILFQIIAFYCQSFCWLTSRI